jgi:hypothetical protein
MKIYGVSKGGRIYREEQEVVKPTEPAKKGKPGKPVKPIVPIGMKACSRCKEVLPMSSFHLDSNSSDGHRSACKACVSKIGRERRAGKC